MPRIQDHAPIPRRTLTDKRLAAAHFRLLGAIGTLSRPSASGPECTARQLRLGEVAGIAPTKVPTIIRRLVDLGYLKCSPIPTNRRALVYRILYADAEIVTDKTTYQGGGVPPPPTAALSKPAAVSIPTQIVGDPELEAHRTEPAANQEAFPAAAPDTDTPADQAPDRGGAPLPAGWALTMELREYAEQAREKLGLPWVDLDFEADQFVAHYRALSGPAANDADWTQRWLDWAIAAATRKPAAAPAPIGNTLPKSQQFKPRLIDRMTAYAEEAMGTPSNGDLDAF